jgi:hypothetical protein
MRPQARNSMPWLANSSSGHSWYTGSTSPQPFSRYTSKQAPRIRWVSSSRINLLMVVFPFRVRPYSVVRAIPSTWPLKTQADYFKGCGNHGLHGVHGKTKPVWIFPFRVRRVFRGLQRWKRVLQAMVMTIISKPP